MIVVKSPHSILAALETRPKDVIELLVPPRGSADAWAQVERLAAQQRVHTRVGKGPASGEAKIRPRGGLSVEEVLEPFDASQHRVWLALDGLQDPHNVGAIFRTAAFFGVAGILMTEERSAPLSSVAYDVSSGGLEHVPFVQLPNLQRGFEIAKDRGLWILGTSEHAPQDLSSIQLDRSWLIVLGNEEKGMRRLTQERCDVLCRISPRGAGVLSLNVSVATGVCLAQIR